MEILKQGQGDPPEGIFDNAEVISSYSRAQAIEDGQLVDVTGTAKEAGFKYPVAVTQNLLARWIIPDEKAKRYGQETQGRLWDVLWMLRVASRTQQGKSDFIEYRVIFQDGPGQRNKHTVKLWAKCDGGDDGEPVITIMLPEDY